MTMHVSHEIRRYDGAGRPQNPYVLPPLAGVPAWRAPAMDRIGELLQHAPIAAGAVGIAGGLGGALVGGAALGASLLGAVVGTAAGAATGAAGGITGLAAIQALLGRDYHAAPPNAPVGPTPPTAVQVAEPVSVMTYNIHGGMGGSRERWSTSAEMDQLASVIRNERPDILLLQEVDRSAVRSNFSDNLRELTDRLHPTGAVVASPGTHGGGRTQSVGVMTFNGFNVGDARNLIHADPDGSGVARRVRGLITDARKSVAAWLGKPEPAGMAASYSPRNTLDTLVTTPGGSVVRVLSGHYQGPREDYDSQADQLAPVAAQLATWAGPTIWGGDFNVSFNKPAYQQQKKIMGSAGLTDAYAGAGIDRVWVSPHFQATSAYAVQEKDPASDHPAVVTKLTVRPASAPAGAH